MNDQTFDEPYVLDQLNSSGTISYQNLMNIGFPFHLEFNHVCDILRPHIQQYNYIPTDDKKLCDAFMRSIDFSTNDFKIGATKIFLRPGKMDIFESACQTDTTLMIKKLKSFILSMKLKSLVYAIIYLNRGMLDWSIFVF